MILSNNVILYIYNNSDSVTKINIIKERQWNFKYINLYKNIDLYSGLIKYNICHRTFFDICVDNNFIRHKIYIFYFPNYDQLETRLFRIRNNCIEIGNYYNIRQDLTKFSYIVLKIIHNRYPKLNKYTNIKFL